MNSFPDHIKTFKPAIGSGFVSHLSPNSLLGIEPWLVRGKVGKVNTCVGSQETPNLLPFMPGGPIYVQPDRVPRKSTIELPETSKKSFPVSLGAPQYPHLPEQRGNPTKEIQSPMMLACRGDSQPLAPLAPSYPKTRMQGEPRFIFKNNRLVRLQGPKFFLTSGGTVWHPRSAPAGSYGSLASSGTPVDASIIIKGGRKARWLKWRLKTVTP